MPIVVDEVVISVDLANEGGAAGPGGARPSGGTDLDRQALVNECVERVLEILADREER